MSLQYSNINTKGGILQRIERKLKLGDGYITGNINRLKEWTSDVNMVFDKIWALIFKTAGKWQFDDSNHTDYPIITTSLIQNQRDYTFVEDEQGNLILDIYKVMVKDETGTFHEIYPVDQQSDEDMQSFYSGLNETGTPSRYDKTGNGIFLDCIPAYSSAGGLKVFINREGSYFTTSDTTKKPGVAGLFHEYFVLVPSYDYACTNQLANKKDLKNEILEMEANIKKHYRDRSRDEVPTITSEYINSI
jgi:hypothetical protein